MRPSKIPKPSHRRQASADANHRALFATLYERNPNVEVPFPHVRHPNASSSPVQPERRLATKPRASLEPLEKPKLLITGSLSSVQQRIPASQTAVKESPGTPPPLQSVTLPDLLSPPFTGPLVDVFTEEIYDELAEHMDERALDLYVVCIGIICVLRASRRFLEYSGYLENLLGLGEAGVEEVRLSSYLVAWKLLTGKWTWEALLEERLLIETVKRNIRNIQLHGTRLDESCEAMVKLGFTEEYLYP